MSTEHKNNSIERYPMYRDLAFQYHVAALSLWVSIVESPYLYNPCMFLGRHTIELLLKGLIYRDCGDLDGMINTGKKKRSIDNTHDLSALWNHYVRNMQPRLLSTPEDMNKTGKAINRILKRDIDSTKYRYPEAKKPRTMLKLEPIRIKPALTFTPELGDAPPLIVTSQSSKTRIITSGAADLKRGNEMFELIELLFQMMET